jgi:hypothetical protein
MKTIDQMINRQKMVVYKNAAINAKMRLGASNFYKAALETIRYYKNANSHNVPTIQAYCNLMGYSSDY